MEFVKKSSQSVIDVVIPEGNVIKITDKATGHILWEKKRDLAPNASWITRMLETYGSLNMPSSANPTIRCLSKDTYKNTNQQTLFQIRIGASDAANQLNAHTFTDWFTRYTENDSWEPRVVDTLRYYNNDQHMYSSAYVMPSKVLTISDDGLMTIFYTGASDYAGYWVSDSRDQRNGAASTGILNARKINTPSSETDIRIIHSPERNEYLVTGIGYTCAIPETLSGRTTQGKYSNKKIKGACWCSRDNLYYGAFNGSNALQKRCISYSSDGYTWTDVYVFPLNSTAFGVVDMTASKRLVAFSSDTSKIALSSDGKNWELMDVPFKYTMGYAYSPEYDLLLVLSGTTPTAKGVSYLDKIYMTNNFKYWQELSAPVSKLIFKDFFHCSDGIFAGTAYQSDRFYILTTQTPIK